MRKIWIWCFGILLCMLWKGREIKSFHTDQLLWCIFENTSSSHQSPMFILSSLCLFSSVLWLVSQYFSVFLSRSHVQINVITNYHNWYSSPTVTWDLHFLVISAKEYAYRIDLCNMLVNIVGTNERFVISDPSSLFSLYLTPPFLHPLFLSTSTSCFSDLLDLAKSPLLPL